MAFFTNYLRLCSSIGKKPATVGQEIGVSKTAVTHWSNGTIPSQITRQQIADYFGVTVEELMADEEIKKDTTQKGDVSKDDFIKNLNHMSSSELLDVISIASKIIKDRG